jgi:hypothetical protein
MKRREFVEKLGIGSALIVSSSALSAPGHAAPTQDDQGEHNHRPVSGDRANATVSFGQWHTGIIPAGTDPVTGDPLPQLPPLDRYAPGPVNPRYNSHLVIPHVATIKEGGSVNFVIAGLHQVAVYGPGTRPENIDTTLIRPMQNPPFNAPPVGPLPLINDPNNRLYIGPDPSFLPLDRVEVVHFANPGRYLVICAFLFHFLDNMFGYVRVRRDDDND